MNVPRMRHRDEESLKRATRRRQRQGQVVKANGGSLPRLMERDLEDWRKRQNATGPDENANGRKPFDYLENQFKHRLPSRLKC